VTYNFRDSGRGRVLLLPPSVDEWLPADHLAWFVLDAVERIDLASFEARPGRRRMETDQTEERANCREHRPGPERIVPGDDDARAATILVYGPGPPLDTAPAG